MCGKVFARPLSYVMAQAWLRGSSRSGHTEHEHEQLTNSLFILPAESILLFTQRMLGACLNKILGFPDRTNFLIRKLVLHND